MPEFGNPVSAAVAGTSPQAWAPGVNATSVRFYNLAATAVYIVVGTGPATVAGANQWFLPGVIGNFVDISLTEQWEQGEQPQTALTFSLASSATINVWAQVNQ